LETCSPPSSPTDSSSTAPRDNHRKHYPVPQTVMVLNPGILSISNLSNLISQSKCFIVIQEPDHRLVCPIRVR
jgi:hypothetical protein